MVQENFLETGQIICAALLGALFATFASVGQEIMSGIDDLSICNFILSLVVQFVIIVLFFAICSFYVIRTVNNITFLEKARKNMCKDILEILKNNLYFLHATNSTTIPTFLTTTIGGICILQGL